MPNYAQTNNTHTHTHTHICMHFHIVKQLNIFHYPRPALNYDTLLLLTILFLNLGQQNSKLSSEKCGQLTDLNN